ncbi:MAG TPA: glycerol-3-phosphate 1-O-acyltransferase PlsY [Clostridia bacterium]|nr:glycerol-3-phosphate 1-O-acyltransferase PlsY [Clostridia bacterium]
MALVWSAIIGYFIGSIPIGYLVVRKLYNIDIRRYGSGNIGFTNVFRTAGWGPGIIVLVGDILKGVIAVLVGRWLGGETAGMLGGLAAIAGHNWSLFLKFSGGRGVATGAGVFLALAPKVIGIAALIWLITIALTRYVSLGSILGAVSVPILILIFHESWLLFIFGLLAAVFVIYRHRPNIKRLLNGTEYKFGEKVQRKER